MYIATNIHFNTPTHTLTHSQNMFVFILLLTYLCFIPIILTCITMVTCITTQGYEQKLEELESALVKQLQTDTAVERLEEQRKVGLLLMHICMYT